MFWCGWQESNPHHDCRRILLYPLSYSRVSELHLRLNCPRLERGVVAPEIAHQGLSIGAQDLCASEVTDHPVILIASYYDRFLKLTRRFQCQVTQDMPYTF